MNQEYVKSMEYIGKGFVYGAVFMLFIFLFGAFSTWSDLCEEYNYKTYAVEGEEYEKDCSVRNSGLRTIGGFMFIGLVLWGVSYCMQKKKSKRGNRK